MPDSIAKTEPALVGGIGTGVALTTLYEPLMDIMTELHASPKLSAATVKIILIALPTALAFWARARTVATVKHESLFKAALELPAGAQPEDAAVLAAQRSLTKKEEVEP